MVDAETGGPGDDIALKTNTGKSLEVQVKRGLKRGNDLWDATYLMEPSVLPVPIRTIFSARFDLMVALLLGQTTNIPQAIRPS